MRATCPELFALEVDHDALCRYLRAKSLRLWVVGLGMIGLMFALPWCANLTLQTQEYGGWSDFLCKCSAVLFKCAVIPAVAGAAIYIIFRHRSLGKQARSLCVTVEGAYLRIVEDRGQVYDQKIHFRSIAKYDAKQDRWMRRHGIGQLSLLLAVPAPNFSPFVEICGFRDHIRIRDLLAEVGSSRAAMNMEAPEITKAIDNINSE